MNDLGWKVFNALFPRTLESFSRRFAANVLNELPQSIQGKAKAGLWEIWKAETKAHAEKAFDRFVRDFGAKYPKAVAKRVKDRAALLAFYDFPAEHWVPIRTTNPIESSFATIRHRTTRTKNCVSRNTLLGLVFQLALTAEQSWRKLGGFKLLPAVVQGIRFVDGLRVTDQPPTEFAEEQQIAA